MRNECMADLRNFPVVRQGEVADLHDLIGAVRAFKAVLHRQGRPYDYNAEYIYEDLTNKIPPEYHRELSKWRRDHPQMECMDRLEAWAVYQVSQEKAISKKALEYKRLLGLGQGKKTKQVDMLSLDMSNPSHTYTLSNQKPVAKEKFEPAGSGNRRVCECCRGEVHALATCPKFIKAEPTERKNFVKCSKRCFICLKKNHSASNCRHSEKCGQCNSTHHTLLHGADQKVNLVAVLLGVPDSESEEEGVVEHSMLATVEQLVTPENTKGRKSLQTVTVMAENITTGRRTKTTVLLDLGSTSTILSDELATELNLKLCTTASASSPFKMDTAGGKVRSYASFIANVRLWSIDETFKTIIGGSVIPEPTGSYKPIDWKKAKSKWKHLHRVEFPDLSELRPAVGVLLGVDFMDLHRPTEMICGPTRAGPDARLCPLGWAAAGQIDPDDKSEEDITQTIAFIHKNVSEQKMLRSHEILQHPERYPHSFYAKDILQRGGETEWEELDKLVRSQWDIEKVPEKVQPMSENDKTAIRAISRGRIVNGRYRVPCLWKSKERPKISSYPMAARRLEAMRRPGAFPSELARKNYFGKLWTYVEKKYFRVVPKDEPRPKFSFHMPHFGVVKKGGKPEDVRPVMDCKATFKGRSLNSFMTAGPKLMSDLPVVLLRFRRHSVGIAGDISEMFLQIEMEEEDRPFHRILTENPQGEVVELEAERFIFGDAGAVNASVGTLFLHAMPYVMTFPEAVDLIINSTIIDDHIGLVETRNAAIRLMFQLQKIYKDAGMEIRKWICSEPEVLASIPEKDRATQIDIARSQEQECEMVCVKALGLFYEAKNDEFTFNFAPEMKLEWTKLAVLQTFMALFDPLGFVMPFTLKARLCYQTTWKEKLDWKDKLTSTALKDWQNWTRDLPLLSKFKIPRCVQIKFKEDQIERQEIHVFSDASEYAYGSVAYLRTKYLDGAIAVRFLISRAKIGPMRYLSIPRLELEAAMTALGLKKTISQSYPDLSDNFTFWVDSKVILGWIQMSSKIMKVAIGNRVSTIHEETSIRDWNFVPTDLNPADLVSRGCAAQALLEHTLWHRGPPYLRGEEATPKAPQFAVTDEIKEGLKKGQKAVTAHSFFLTNEKRKAKVQDGYDQEKEIHPSDPEAASDYYKLLRVRSFANRFVRNYVLGRWPHREYDGHHKQFELVEAETQVIKEMQAASYAKVIWSLEHGEALTLDDPLAPYNPVLDSEGVLRVSARLRTVDGLPLGATNPVILHKDHPTTRTILETLHRKDLNHMGGPRTLLGEFNKNYFAKGAPSVAKKVVTTCVHCLKRTPHKPTQPEAPLPDDRVQWGKSRLAPFASTGVDAAGPYWVKHGARSTAKRWILVFVCAQYRAIHLEVLHSMDTASFLMACTRFLARRPRPIRFRSDNGTNFLGAESIMCELLDVLEVQELRQMYPKIEWVFNPPRSPHMGGFFERLVGTMKRALDVTLPTAEITDEEFSTVLAGVEASMNSRPLAKPTAEDPSDDQALTPSHFIVGSQFPELIILPENGKWSHKQRWHQLQKILDDFWSRFVKEMIPQYHKMNQLAKNPVTFSPGDLVLILEKKTRGRWPMARILEVHETPRDGIARSLTVEIGSKIMNKPVHEVLKLQVFDVEEEEMDD